MTTKDIKTRTCASLMRDLSGPPEVMEELRSRLSHYTELLWTFRFPLGSIGRTEDQTENHYARTYGQASEETPQP